MTQDLLTRITQLRDEISNSDGRVRAEALTHLSDAVETLQTRGAAVPAWVHRHLSVDDSDPLEDQFDNMPV